jgi:glycosyltransferase involved in cell wall biosynthesis
VIVSDGRIEVAKWMSPLKLFEYMALARPIVASDLPVLREVLRDGDNARLAQPDDAEDWERVIDELLADSEGAAAMGARARNDIETKYSWRHRARAIAQALGL